MTTASVEPARRAVRERTLVDRLLAAFPVVALALGVLIFYGVEAWLRKTPWVFTDELEWTQISRSIAATGHAARRGEPIFFKSLYAVPDRAVLVDPLDADRLRGDQVRERRSS